MSGVLAGAVAWLCALVCKRCCLLQPAELTEKFSFCEDRTALLPEGWLLLIVPLTIYSY
jgi:hypothetical protein